MKPSSSPLQPALVDAAPALQVDALQEVPLVVQVSCARPRRLRRSACRSATRSARPCAGRLARILATAAGFASCPALASAATIMPSARRRCTGRARPAAEIDRLDGERVVDRAAAHRRSRHPTPGPPPGRRSAARSAQAAAARPPRRRAPAGGAVDRGAGAVVDVGASSRPASAATGRREQAGRIAGEQLVARRAQRAAHQRLEQARRQRILRVARAAAPAHARARDRDRRARPDNAHQRAIDAHVLQRLEQPAHQSAGIATARRSGRDRAQRRRSRPARNDQSALPVRGPLGRQRFDPRARRRRARTRRCRTPVADLVQHRDAVEAAVVPGRRRTPRPSRAGRSTCRRW